MFTTGELTVDDRLEELRGTCAELSERVQVLGYALEHALDAVAGEDGVHGARDSVAQARQLLRGERHAADTRPAEATPAVAEKELTERGFRIFAGKECAGEAWCGEVSVVESSCAGEGPHVRIYSRVSDGHVELSLTAAEAVLDGLGTFVAEARAGLLTEKVRD